MRNFIKKLKRLSSLSSNILPTTNIFLLYWVSFTNTEIFFFFCGQCNLRRFLTGPYLMEEYGLLPLTAGYTYTYDPAVKVQITNEFATAAFRYGHSLIRNYNELSLTSLQCSTRLT